MSAYQVQSDPTAVVGRRVGAFIVDIVIIFLAFLIPFFSNAKSADSADFGGGDLSQFCATDVSFDDDGFSSSDNDVNVSIIDGQVCISTEDSVITVEDTWLWISIGLSVGAWFLIRVVMEGISGSTPGKAIFGVRVVNAEGQAPGMGKAFLRNLVLIVDQMFCYLVGLILALTTKGHRRLGDMAASTYVVGRDRTGTPVMLDAPLVGSPYVGAPVGAPAGATFGAQPPPPGAAPAAPVGGAAPQWDPQRSAYIQWDAARNTWLQFDDTTQEWKPIS